MIRWLIDWSLRFRRIVLVAAVGLVVFGIAQLNDLKRDVLPEFSPVTVEVQTEALGLSAAEVERLMTIPLEQDLLSGVAFLESIESASLPGLSSVVMTFEPGTDILDARQVVAERLAQAAGLPQVADPPRMIQPLSSTSRVAMVSLSSDELTPIETSVLARWVVVPRLLGVKGVANVSIWGFRDRQLQVLVDPARLEAQGVTLSQVISTAGNALEVSPLTFLEASSPGTGGFIDTVNQRLHVFHEQAISTADELATVPVEDGEGGAVYVDGRPLTLGEVTRIDTSHQPLIGDAQCSGGPCVLLVIEKFPDANTPAVSRNIDAALHALQPGLPGIDIDSSLYRPAAYVSTSTNNLALVVAIGGALAVLAALAFFLDWRFLLVALTSVVVSLFAAGAVFFMAGTTVNTMILAGLVLALVAIVDDAIVGSWSQAVMPNDDTEHETLQLWNVREATLRTRSATLYATMIVAAASAVFFFLEGEGGAFLPHIASAYLLALSLAVLVSLTVTPAMSAFVFRNRPIETRKSSALLKLGESLTPWWRSNVLTKPTIAVVTLIVLVAAAAVGVGAIDQDLRPRLKQRDVLVRLEAPPGTSLTAMDEIVAQMVFDIGSLDGVGNVGAHVGRAIASDQIVNVNSAEIWSKIEPDADYAAALDAIEDLAAGAQDVAARVETYSDQQVTEILGRSADQIVVRVYGDNSGVLRSTAEDVLAAVEGIEGIEGAAIDLPVEEPTIEIAVDVERSQAAGLKPGDVRRVSATLLSGIVVGNLFEEQKVFDVVVWGEPAIRQTVSDVEAMRIPTPTGTSVQLADVADVRVASGPAVIKHESVEPYLDVTARVPERSIDDVADAVEAAVAEIAYPLEYHAELLGGFADEQAAESRATAVLVAAVLGIFILLQAAFGSWRLATLAFLTLPVALTGGVLAIVATGGEAGLGSIAGLVAVLGLATRQTVHLIRNYLERQRNGEEFGETLVVDGTRELLIPLLAPIAALAGLLIPLVVAGSLAGLEIVGPMAWVVLGGLLTMLVQTLIVVPAVYLRWGHVVELDTTAQDLFDQRPAVMEGG